MRPSAARKPVRTMKRKADIAIMHKALRFQAERVGLPMGHTLAELRARIAADPMSDYGEVTARDEIDRIKAITMDHMPPETDDVALLVDAICFRLGYTNRADAWRAAGINPNRGRDLLARNARAVDWPIWFTLRHTALGF